jgi:hypothetical protein
MNNSQKFSSLREPLHQYEVGALSPKSHRKQSSNDYLPPYRYDDNESVYNKYLASDEAYGTVAKVLLLEYESSKNEYEPYDIILKTLTISQIKQFSDAHMEKVLTLPTFPEHGESSNAALLRRVDAVFGVVLIEFYATRDGILLGPQVENLTKKNRKVEESRQDSDSSSLTRPRVIGVTTNMTDVSLIGSSTQRSVTFQPGGTNDKKNQQRDRTSIPPSNSNMHDGAKSIIDNNKESKLLRNENSFDKIYNAEVEEDSYLGNIINRQSSDNASLASKSILRQELLNEVVKLKDIIKSADNEEDKQRYRDHLYSLETELDLINDLDRDKNTQSIQPCDKSEVMDRNIPNDNSLVVTVVGSEEKDVTTYTTEIVNDQSPSLEIQNNSPDLEANIKSPKHEIDNKSHNPEIVHKNRSLEFVEDEEELHPMPIDEKIIQSKGFIHIRDVEKGFKFATLIAHQNLKDGLLFQARYRNEYFTIRVPQGGVRKGQAFSSPMLHPSGEKENVVSYESLLDGMNIPKGRWRDRVFNCCSDPMLSLSFICPNGKFW